MRRAPLTRNAALMLAALAATLLSASSRSKEPADPSLPQLVRPNTSLAPEGFGFLFVVNSTGDGNDSAPGDNFCETNINDECTLRAAITEANARPEEDGILISIPTSDPGYDASTGRAVINVPLVLPDIRTDMSFSGPGANRLVVRAASIGSKFRVFNVTNGAKVGFSRLTITNGTVSGPIGAGGGGIRADGNVTITDCAIVGNRTPWSGGGIANFDTMTIRNSTISGNFARGTANDTGRGGGIYNDNSGAFLHIINSTISDNIAEEGGGIANYRGAINISNCTITNNFVTGGNSPAAGGIWNVGVHPDQVSIQIRSTIVAANVDYSNFPDVGGKFISSGFNLIGMEDGSTGFTSPTDQKGGFFTSTALDPKLDALGLSDNGGRTRTYALRAGSPARDKGTSASLSGSLTTDQRGSGFARNFDDPAVANASGGDGTDIGAFEAQPLELINVSRAQDDITVTFKAIAGNTFRLERMLSLPGADWQSIGGVADLRATSTGPADITHTDASGERAFYRVRLVR